MYEADCDTDTLFSTIFTLWVSIKEAKLEFSSS